MRDPSQVIVDRLVAIGGIGVFNASTGWCIRIGEPGASPDTVILVNDAGGSSPYPHLLLNFPSLQVIVRGAKGGYVLARAKANDIVKVLLGMPGLTDPTSGDVYQSCTQIGEIAYLGQDDNTRPIFSMNFSFIVLPVAEAGGHRVAI